jgi:hypothetical protein
MAPMKMRTGLIIGFGAGYVLGTKAGRQRYRQIYRAFRTVAENPPIKRVIEDTKVLTDTSTVKARAILAEQLEQASEVIREKADE